MAIATLRPDGTYSSDLPVQYPNSDEHWDKVDEVVADDDTTYVATTVGGASSGDDYYELSALPAGVGAISNVKVIAVCRETADEFGEVRLLIAEDFSNEYASPIQYLSNTYQSYSYDWAVNPSTGVAWTVSDINAWRYGVSLYSAGGGTVHSRCTQLYVEVTYGLFIPKVFIM